LAKVQLLKYSDFVHLTETEKEAYVINMMELMVEQEKGYKKDPKSVVKINSSFLDYYVYETLKHSFFIQNVRAEEIPSWVKTANDYILLIDERNKDSCIFAGWISTMTSTNICAHPGKLTSKAGELYKKFTKGCTSQGKIACNPLIFGYKKMSDENVFCVDSALGAHNSSYECMKEALKDTTTTSSSESDPKEKRIEFLKQVYNREDHFNGIQKFVLDVCVCKIDQMNISDKYSKYMVPHRTCLGLMGMASKSDICVDVNSINEDHFYQTIDKLLQKITDEKLTGKEVDTLYKNKLDELIKSEKKEKMCGSQNIPTETEVIIPEEKEDEYVCGATCKKEKSGATCRTEVTLKGKDNTQVKHEVSSDLNSLQIKDTELEIKVQNTTDEGTKILCKITWENEPPTSQDPQVKLSGVKNKGEYIVTAKLSNSDGWDFKWIPRNTNDQQIDISGENKNDVTGMAKEESQDSVEQTEFKIVQKRYKKNYDICGELTSTKQTGKTISDCITIEKLEDKPLNNNSTDEPSSFIPAQLPPPPMPPIRRSSDMSAPGIR
jgi:hypothetical protein